MVATSSILVLLLLLHTGFDVAGESSYSYCSSEGITHCEPSNRLCNVDDASANESCGACLNGYVELADVCTHIGSLNLDSFVSKFKPFFGHHGSAVQASDHQSALQEIASFISSHNSMQPPPKFVLSLNKFAADTVDEVKQRLGFRPSNNTSKVLPPVDTNGTVTSTRVDWVQGGAVTSVKDQGRCGCCWAVSMAGALEGAAAIASNFSYLQSLSFQQFISCDHSNYGCEGGSQVLALEYAESNTFGGMARLNDYAYTDDDGSTTQSCNLRNQKLAVEAQGSGYVVAMDSILI